MTLAKIIFLIMIASPTQERHANLLVDSIRSFGGKYSEVPIYLVTCSDRLPDPELRRKVTKVVPLQMPDRYRSFPFADKVWACSQVEKMEENQAEWLVWLNPEMLVLAEPSELAGPLDAGAQLRPVHHRNVGSLAAEPIDEFWQGVYKVAGVDASQVWTVESFVDRQTIRAYYNSGFMAYRPSKGVFRAWKASFESLLADPALLARVCPDDQHKFFVHQAILSAVTVGRLKEDQIKILPPAYGYPLLLHRSVAADRRPTNLTDFVTLIHDGVLEQLLKGINMTPDLRNWLRERGVNP